MIIEDLWYKNAVVYCLDVETFMDGNGDGVGDFVGLRERLDYLAGFGVNCLWLLPFYKSPNRDNGYDISDYYEVDPRLGDLGDFVEFSHQAKLHGIRVIVDLVANHTSDEHPWFQAARRDPKSRFRDFYVWSPEKPADAHEGMVFPGVQKSTWTRDEVSGEYYFHRFFEFQPDLNVANPAVRRELQKVMGFWLELGVAGFRVDAVPFLVLGHGGRGGDDPFVLLSDMREFLSWRAGEAVLLAEANVPYGQVESYFDDGRRMQLVFDFIANQHLFLSLADEDATPLAKALREEPVLRYTAQWAQFLRNHDELDLGRLSEAERGRVFARFGPESRMQLYGRGLRRRLAPMLEGDARRLRLAHSLLLSLPGTPVFWYGEELGMGEDLSLEDRHSIRTPMQWSGDRHGGFSRAAKVVRPVVSEGAFSFERVNVASQRRDPGSLLNATERLVRLRKECREIGWGARQVVETGEKSVLGIQYEWKGRRLLVLHNLAGAPRKVSLRLRDEGPDGLVNIAPGTAERHAHAGEHALELEPYGFRWYRVGEEDPPLAPESEPA